MRLKLVPLHVNTQRDSSLWVHCAAQIPPTRDNIRTIENCIIIQSHALAFNRCGRGLKTFTQCTNSAHCICLLVVEDFQVAKFKRNSYAEYKFRIPNKRETLLTFDISSQSTHGLIFYTQPVRHIYVITILSLLLHVCFFSLTC